MSKHKTRKYCDYKVASTEKLIEVIDSEYARKVFIDYLIKRLKKSVLLTQYDLINEAIDEMFDDIIKEK